MGGPDVENSLPSGHTTLAMTVLSAVACIASWWLARRGMVRHHDGPGGSLGWSSSASSFASFGSIATAPVFLATWRRLEIA
ncbi:hypothetical protein [Prauserella sp. PE36]|uniref:hypothetical protein n=1 Tax=Prauserella sp. PE36 TaxID=1504709 RepID=UPI0018F48EDE|nr:hypothetical protein [Prauserella sp. PE36]